VPLSGLQMSLVTTYARPRSPVAPLTWGYVVNFWRVFGVATRIRPVTAVHHRTRCRANVSLFPQVKGDFAWLAGCPRCDSNAHWTDFEWTSPELGPCA
jgi:hypothetical protein